MLLFFDYGLGTTDFSALAPQQLHYLIRRSAGEGLPGAVRPEDLDGIQPRRRSQAEVGATILAAQVALVRVDPADPAPAAGPNGDFRAVRVAPERRIDRLYHQPVAALGRHVAIQASRSGDGSHQEVQSPVAVDVGGNQSPIH